MHEKFPFLGNLHPLSLSQQSASVEASVIDFGTSRVDKSIVEAIIVLMPLRSRKRDPPKPMFQLSGFYCIVTSRLVGRRLMDREACYCRGARVVT